MKRKNTIWLTISTLVLCVGVMAFGVYSAISATLNINGTLGFNMHDCMVTVSGTIYNLAEMDSTSSSASKVDRTIERTVMGGESTTTTTINVGELYFYYGADADTGVAKLHDIIFQLTFTNLTDKSVEVSVPAPVVGNTTAITILDADDNVNYNTLPYSTVLSANGQSGSTTTVMFALKLTDSSALTEEVEFSWNNIEFKEFSLIKEGTVENSIDSDNGSTYYYIEMGTDPNTGKALRWVPFAVYDEDAGDYTTFSKTTKPESGKTYYFISEYILDLPVDSTSTSAYGISYSFYNTSDSSTAVYYVNGTPTTTSGIKPNDYSVSNIRSYLNGGEAYKCRDTSNNYYALTTETMTGENAFATYFGLSDDSIYTGDYITSRPLTGTQSGATFSLYSDLSATTATTRPTTESTFTATAKAAASDKDKLWLPSYFEIYNYYGNKASSGNAIYKASRLTTQGADAQTAGTWWLRTPYTTALSAYLVSANGDLTYNGVSISNRAARPAFQISIPA